MRKKINQLTIWSSWLMKLAIILLLPSTIKLQGFQIASLFIFCIFLGFYYFPSYFKKRNKDWPIFLDFCVTGGLLINALGYAYNLFDDEICTWWDEFAHFSTTFLFGIFLFYLIASFETLKTKILKRERPKFTIFTILMILGLIWEGVEYTFDRFFDLEMQPSKGDTLIDLQMNALGALLIVFIGTEFFIIKKSEFKSNKMENLKELESF